jgi:hypothetical protein
MTQECIDIFGLFWYWWAIAAGVAATIWTYFYVTRKTEE